MGGPNLADLPTEEIVRQLLRATKTPLRLVVDQFDVEAALRRHLAIPQTRGRRYSISLTHYPKICRNRFVGERSAP